MARMIAEKLPPLAEVIAANVRRLRMENGWSQVALAEKLKWHRTRVNELEAQRYGKNMAALEALADVFGVDYTELVKVTDI